jgi:hypothetical protein
MSSSTSELESCFDSEPTCSQCVIPMTRANSIPAFAKYPQLDIYRCEVCGQARTIKRPARNDLA